MLTAWAQQSAQYTTYMLDPFRYNPAYAGLDYGLSFTGTIRQQWQGLDGAPSGQRFSAHMPLYFLSGGFGVQLDNDQVGAHRFTSLQGAYNYQSEVGAGVFSAGVAGTYQSFSLDGAALRTPDGDYTGPGTIVHNDNILNIASESGGAINVSAGVFFQTERFDVGLSAENLTESTVSLSQLNYILLRTYHVYAASRHQLSSSFMLQPSLWFRSDAIENQLDISARVTYNDNIFVGASFRGYSETTRDALAILFGFKLSPTSTLAYAYDVALSPLQSVHNGSHELTVKYLLDRDIGKGKLPPIIYHPRAKR